MDIKNAGLEKKLPQNMAMFDKIRMSNFRGVYIECDFLFQDKSFQLASDMDYSCD